MDNLLIPFKFYLNTNGGIDLTTHVYTYKGINPTTYPNLYGSRVRMILTLPYTCVGIDPLTYLYTYGGIDPPTRLYKNNSGINPTTNPNMSGGITLPSKYGGN